LLAADIEGEVRAEPNSTVALNAKVQLLNLRFLVDERMIGTDGRFKFRNIGAGSYVIAVQLEGYVEQEVSVVIERRMPRAFIPILLQPIKGRPQTRADTVSIAEYQIPKEARREFDQALADRQRGDCAGAISHIQRALALFDRYAKALDLQGGCLAQMRNVEAAEASFKRALLYGDGIYPYINLADLYSEGKRFDEAQALLQQALTKYPTDGDLHFALGLVYFNQGNLGEAERHGLDAHSKSHRNPDVHLMLSKIFLKQRKYPELRIQLETYLVENPKSPSAGQVRMTLSDLRKRTEPEH
jgi:tetratricopeptide (TPR) repeat protein